MYYDNFLNVYAKRHNIKITTEIMNGLNFYNPREIYSVIEGQPQSMTDTRYKIEVGRISNLIKRMSEENAPIKELTKAFRHLLVVIDAQKYFLDYKKSEQDHDILKLREKYPYKAILH